VITTASEMLEAFKGSKPRFTGLVLYEGPSLIDGAPIVVIANRIANPSTNVKTGAIAQTFIIRSDMRPLDAIKSGADESVCGSCLARPANEGFCYVQVGRSVESVYGAFTRGRYARPGIDYDPAIVADVFADTRFRMGSYGDPAAAPFAIWENAASLTKSRYGYTHQWRARPEFAALCMASCDTEQDHLDAKAAGWRTFRMRLALDDKAPREVACPASKESGFKTTCESCGACGGLSSKAKADIVIIAHGPTASRYAAWRGKLAA